MFFDKQTIVFKNRLMFGYYITLRMRSGLRLLKEIGHFSALQSAKQVDAAFV